MSTSEKVSASDLALLTAAQAELANAQNVVGFAQAHIARVYGLAQGDKIRADGTIERTVSD